MKVKIEIYYFNIYLFCDAEYREQDEPSQAQ